MISYTMVNPSGSLNRGAFCIAILLCILCLWPCGASAQSEGDEVRLVKRTIGVPGHNEPGIKKVSRRIPGGLVVRVTDVDAATGWIQIEEEGGKRSWILRRYVAQVLGASPSAGELCYVVGTWNLEHFRFSAKRGFPENTRGGPTLADRDGGQIRLIADAIKGVLRLRILVLNEINGEERIEDGIRRDASAELESLVSALGPSYDYVIGTTGQFQRVAILYDKSFARLNAFTEFNVPRQVIQGKDIFARDPLVANFTFLVDSQPKNDFILVGLHLASGQHNTRNHDAAMLMVREMLLEGLSGTRVRPDGEQDILIAGDLNASMFDNMPERFFEEFNSETWAVLAGPRYPATRLSSIPLHPRSKIDYLIASRNTGEQDGLLDDEIASPAAAVHQELAAGDWAQYRDDYSDHFPVTTCIRVVDDDD